MEIKKEKAKRYCEASLPQLKKMLDELTLQDDKIAKAPENEDRVWELEHQIYMWERLSECEGDGDCAKCTYCGDGDETCSYGEDFEDALRTWIGYTGWGDR
jgi:hypothetical protein